MKAVVQVGGKQYIVTEKETLLVDRLQDGTKELTLDALMVFDDKTATVGTPTVKGATVKAQVVEDEVKGDKLRIIHFQAKKRVNKVTGHRQKHSRIQITGISAK
ncbi:50S ribosomal protein L21 [Candidatus Saccharibacteria bacterium]|nr:MAG: 50S ribosomal protein L21 [Candidatus Saccharibacteria bacterium]